MANTIHVDVVSAEELIYTGEAEFVALPGEVGELGILPGHTPLITRIKPGAVRIKVPGESEETFVFVAGGLLEIQPHTVTVLADTAIRGHDLDEAKVLEMHDDSMIKEMYGNSIVEELFENSLVRKLNEKAAILRKQLDK